jgi:hypothetical protein
MTQAEYQSWIEFYQAFPFDDYHRFYRPAAMVAGAMAGGDLQARLNWLQPDQSTSGMNDADMTTLRAFGYKGKGG